MCNEAGIVVEFKDLIFTVREYFLYSKVSIIRPGCSRLLEFEKKDSTGRLIETFSNIQTRSLDRDQKLAMAALK